MVCVCLPGAATLSRCCALKILKSTCCVCTCLVQLHLLIEQVLFINTIYLHVFHIGMFCIFSPHLHALFVPAWCSYIEQVLRINALEPSMRALSDNALAAKTDEFRARLSSRADTLDSLLPEAFAVVREVSRRELDMRHFDSQLVGGMVLHEGQVAEMATGEGKTLVSKRWKKQTGRALCCMLSDMVFGTLL
jgi:hypothetical protein